MAGCRTTRGRPAERNSLADFARRGEGRREARGSDGLQRAAQRAWRPARLTQAERKGLPHAGLFPARAHRLLRPRGGMDAIAHKAAQGAGGMANSTHARDLGSLGLAVASSGPQVDRGLVRKGGLEPPRLAALEPRRERGRMRNRTTRRSALGAWRGKGQAFAGAISPSLGLAVASSRPQVDRGLVRKGGLEPPRLAALEPKSRASTNSATFARCEILRRASRPVPATELNAPQRAHCPFACS